MNPSVTFTPDSHFYSYEECDVEVRLERFHEDRYGGISAEVAVSAMREPSRGLLHRGRVNLLGSGSRRTFLSGLQSRINGFHNDIDFGAILEQVSAKSVDHYREGEPSVDLREVESDRRPSFLLRPFVERGGASLIFADGGSGKSIVAMAIAVSAASGVAVVGEPVGEPCAVLYLDWEADQYAHTERLRAICAASGMPVPPIHYRRQVSSLSESVNTIRKEVATKGVGLVIIDSLGAARGDEPESAAVTIKLFTAARSLGIPWLGIDHVSKSAGDKTKPFGSVYSHNLARLTWSMDRHQEEGDDEIVVALVNTKRNSGKALRRQAYRIRFESDADEHLEAVHFNACDVRDIPEFAAKLPAKSRILNVLRDGKQATSAVVELTGLSDTIARARLNELRRSGAVVRMGEEWGLTR
jgi:AAA domain